MNRSSLFQRLTAVNLVSVAAALGLATAFAATPTVMTRQATVKGKQETILTDASGMTLYFSSKDGPGKVTCTGRCAKFWPPLLLESGSPTGPASLVKELSVVNGPLGRQVEFKGHPLYRFIKDRKPGEAYGAGLLGGSWHVATPDSPAAVAGKSGW